MPDTDRTLEEFRSYLETLTFIQISPRVRSKFGISDIISRTLLEAYQALDRLREMDEPARKRWLRQAHVNNLLDEINRWKRRKVDCRREEALEADTSSCRLQRWLASEEASPSEQAQEREESLRLLEAISRLPDREREALILQRYHGLKLREIAARLNCTTNAVAGLHAHALQRLRRMLSESE